MSVYPCSGNCNWNVNKCSSENPGFCSVEHFSVYKKKKKKKTDTQKCNGNIYFLLASKSHSLFLWFDLNNKEALACYQKLVRALHYPVDIEWVLFFPCNSVYRKIIYLPNCVLTMLTFSPDYTFIPCFGAFNEVQEKRINMNNCSGYAHTLTLITVPTA